MTNPAQGLNNILATDLSKNVQYAEQFEEERKELVMGPDTDRASHRTYFPHDFYHITNTFNVNKSVSAANDLGLTNFFAIVPPKQWPRSYKNGAIVLET
jgi:hypothetical protein